MEPTTTPTPTAEERLGFLSQKANRVIGEMEAYKAAQGRDSNKDFGCWQLFDAVDELRLSLGEHGAAGAMEELRSAREVIKAIDNFCRVSVAPANGPDAEEAHNLALNQALQAIFVAAREHSAIYAPAFSGDDSAPYFNAGEPERKPQ